MATAGAVLLVFVLAPVILCGNALVLAAVYRYKRLRTPSNYLLSSLAASDLGTGVFLPLGMYLELSGGPGAATSLCLAPYCVAICLCSASVLVMAAIAVDRFTSLAQPLRYNNLITHTSVERYLVAFWLYALAVGFSPLVYNECFAQPRNHGCSFLSLVDAPVQLFLFCTVYGPSAVVLLACYCYVYVVARSHARAIYSVELSLRQHHDSHSRYGLTLAITVGLFLCLWLPFQVCMLLDVFRGSNLLRSWSGIYLSLPIFASSALNPWVYGYRNSEVRLSVQRLLDDLLSRLGFASPRYNCPDLLTTNYDHAEMNSFASNVRLCAVSPNRTTLLLLPSRNETAEGEHTQELD
ncbi:adenosine receptor A2b-like isoform X2 [Bacillus rossius redtenbacheri]|uniref:adenosine receptor A2b-like isoform X2 n=1 Tax=Bacillus rossius redtenbacheri TaxID=93214 RepID=UPI002FDD19FC